MIELHKNLYPQLRDKMTKIIIGCIAASNAALKALRFLTQAVVGGIGLGCHGRAVTNQL
jgi:hypothetical protein